MATQATAKQIFLSDIQRDETHKVVFEADEEGQQFVRNLLLMRVGTWNDVTYTADRLREIAANFTKIQEVDNWEPSLRPQHKYGLDGKPLNVDASETMGWFKKVFFNEDTQLLVGDVAVCDVEFIRDLQLGKLRYTSTEIDPNYVMGSTGEEIGAALVGVSWVENPSVRGMPEWELVINAKEFIGKGSTVIVNQEEGGNPMEELIEKLKSLIGTTPTEEEMLAIVAEVEALVGAGEEGDAEVETESAEAEVAAPEEEGVAAQSEQAEVEVPAAELAPAEGEDEADKVLANMQKTIDAQALQIRTSERNARVQKGAVIVGKLIESGHLPPAQKPSALAIVTHFAESDASAKIMINVQEGDVEKEEEQEVSLLQLFTQMLVGKGPQVQTNETSDSVVWLGSDNPEKMSDAQAEEAGREIARKHDGKESK